MHKYFYGVVRKKIHCGGWIMGRGRQRQESNKAQVLQLLNVNETVPAPERESLNFITPFKVMVT